METSNETARLADIEEALKEVIDPEIGINIFDLGLIYELGLNEAENALTILMTLTTPECPLQDVISAQIAQEVGPIVASHSIEWIWLPPWTPAKITEDGKEMMRAIGFNV